MATFDPLALQEFMKYFPNGNPAGMAPQDMAAYIEAAKAQSAFATPATNPFYGTSQGRMQAGMGPLAAAPTQDFRPAAPAGGPMTLSSVLAAPRPNPTMPTEPSPMPRTTLPYSPQTPQYNTLSGILRQRSSGYMR